MNVEMDNNPSDSDGDHPKIRTDTDTNDDGITPPTKRIKRCCKFKNEWLKEDEFKWLAKGNDQFMAKCHVCPATFSVKSDGVTALRKHMSSDKHKTSSAIIKQSATLSKYFTRKNTPDEDRTTASEVAFAFHSVIHHHSYVSNECSLKLGAKVFSDSKISAKIHCGRTKCESIVENVLAPYAKQVVLDDLKDKSFSVATDASNKGNVKCFPVLVKYFSQSQGVCEGLLQFYDDHNETASAISDRIKSVITDNGLSIHNMSAFTADNASVNYGKHRSVYQSLKDTNSNLVAANCNCHVLHNMAKFACKLLKYDVEGLVIKVFNEFSSSAKKVNELRECFEFVEQEYSAQLRHVPVRWLSLLPAVDRLLRNWKAIRCYFLSHGEEETNPLVWKFVAHNGDAHSSSADELSLPECYLHFVHNYMSAVSVSIKQLESRSVHCTDVFEIMEQMRLSLETRLSDRFYGFVATQAMKSNHLTQAEIDMFQDDADHVYDRSLQYLRKWFPFQTSPLKHFAVLGLRRDFSFDKLMTASTETGLSVDGDELFTEYVALRAVLPKLVEMKDIPVDMKWVDFFSKCEGHFPHLLKLVEFVLSIPASNASAERVFSVMNSLHWSDERNRMRVELVKAELLIKTNISMSCSQFF